MITCGYRYLSSILPLQVEDTHFFGNDFPYVIFINYVINLTISFYWTFCFIFCNCIFLFGHMAFASPLMIFDKLFRKLQKPLTVLRLKICEVCGFLKNVLLPIQAISLQLLMKENREFLNGGLNHTIFHFCVFSLSDLFVDAFKPTSLVHFHIQLLLD